MKTLMGLILLVMGLMSFKVQAAEAEVLDRKDRDLWWSYYNSQAGFTPEEVNFRAGDLAVTFICAQSLNEEPTTSAPTNLVHVSGKKIGDRYFHVGDIYIESVTQISSNEFRLVGYGPEGDDNFAEKEIVVKIFADNNAVVVRIGAEAN